MSAPELKAMPKGEAETVLVTKQSAARSQLESAIWLWFNGIDPVSVHTLAVAAHDCFNALVSHSRRKESELQTWLAAKSNERRKRVRAAQNFFKHGRMNLRGKLTLHTIDSEAFMLDAVNCYEVLHGNPPPLMRLYRMRFLYEHPALITEEALPKFLENAQIHQLGGSTRSQFFQKLFPIFPGNVRNGE